MKDYSETVSMPDAFTSPLGKGDVISFLQSICKQRNYRDVNIFFCVYSGKKLKYCFIWANQHPSFLGKWEWFGEAPIYSNPRWRKRLLANEIKFDDLKGFKP